MAATTTTEWNEAQRTRRNENLEIGTLNEKHADIISNVHFLQARRRKLEMIIGQLTGTYRSRAAPEYSYAMKSSRYEAEAEQLPALKMQLSNAESRFEAARREYAQLDEDALLVKLCDIRMKLCVAQGRGRRIEEECSRIRLENQKLMEDQNAQRSIIDREVVDRSAYERRAANLLAECESLLEACKAQTIKAISFDDIEGDRRHFRNAIDSAMVDIRRQYENLASTVDTEMKQWYDQRVSQVASRSHADSTSQKERLALLRAELIEVRTRLNNLENRNRLLESLIADIEDAKAQDLATADKLLKDDENQLKSLMDQYEAVTGAAPSQQTYSIATLREEILRYRELLYGVGTGLLGSGPAAPGALSIVNHISSSHDIGSGVRTSQTYNGVVSHSRTGSGVYNHGVNSGGSYTHVRNSSLKQITATSGTYSPRQYQIGGGVTSQSHIGSGATPAYSQMSSGAGQYSSQIGYGVTTHDSGSGAVQQSERYAITSSTTTPTVVSKLDYMIKEATDDMNASRISGSEHDFSLHRSAQGNVAIAVSLINPLP
ncbi:hypothetical protein V3C99_017734 [Haemonchus contortus]